MIARYIEKHYFIKIKLFAALRGKLKEGYTLADFRSDMMAGLIVGMVAVPLGMALAIASGVAPQYGLYTVVLAGAIVALLGGSRCQVSGPTAAFVVVLVPIAQKFGFSGLLMAGFMAGILLLIMGFAHMGRLIQFIPYPVTTGFTSGIAVVIATLQLKDFFGIRVDHMPERFVEKVGALVQAFPGFSPGEFAVGGGTLLLLILWPRISKRIPAPLVALTVASIVTIFVRKMYPGFEISTIGSVFTYDNNGVTGHGIPQALPSLGLPWNFVGHDGKAFELSLETIEALVPSAFAIAMLGAIESLLSAVVADGMAHTKHDPDAELVALGAGNIVAPFFGGIPATGAIARTATNIRYGAKSPIAAIVHAVFALLVILFFAPYVSYLPMAALAALLMLVAYNMSEAKHFIHIIRVAPRSDVTVLLMCFGLTVFFDMVVGVTVGVVLAALLFMRRMATITSAQLVPANDGRELDEPLPEGVMLYKIAGPLFFGASQTAVDAIDRVADNVRAVIFVMEDVPVMDMTGLVALESAIRELKDNNKRVYLAGVKAQPRTLFAKSQLLSHEGLVEVFATVDHAVRRCRRDFAKAAPVTAPMPDPARA